MNIQELKAQIESHTVTDEFLIFKDSDSNFISNQYIHEIAKQRGLKIEFVDSLDEIASESSSIFGFADLAAKSSLTVIKSEIYRWGYIDPSKLKSVIVVVNKFEDKSVEKQLENHIVYVPKLEEWQVKDYVYSITEGVDFKKLDWLINLCGTNYHRLQQELDKLKLFTQDEKNYLFDALIYDGALDDLSSYNIFNFTNAIASKDLKTLHTIYKELDRVDVNEFGLLTILLKNFKNILMVQLNSNPTPENTGLESKQLYAIKRIPRVYTPQQLVSIFQLLCDVDRLIKSGELPTEIVIDYLIIKILTA